MAVFDRRTFENATEVLDGNEYKACEFHNCRLVYRGGALPGIAHCNFNKCRWDFEDAAGRTITFMRGLYHGMGPAGKQLIEETFGNIGRP
jgi:hypothetical protein